ncbi:MAG: ATP-binding protein [Flavobacteriaceae bacterium]
MKKGLFLLLVIVSAYHCEHKDVDTKKTADSKLAVLENWINTADDSLHLPLKERREFLVKAVENIQEFNNDSIAVKYLSSISLTYMKLKDSSGFRQTNKMATEKATELKNYKILGESHWDMAAFMDSYTMLDSAYFHYQKAIKNFDQLTVDSTSLALKGRMLYSMGRVQNHFQDYLGAEKNITEALRIFDNLEDYRRIYNCNNMLGIIASGMNNSKKSLEYYKKAGENIKKIESFDKITYIRQNRNNIAHEFLINEEYSKAEKAYTELLTDKDIQMDNPSLYSKALVSKGYAIFKGGGNISEVNNLITKAIAINDSIGFSEDQARAKRYYAEFITVQGDTTKALQYARESKFLAHEASNSDQHLEVLRVLTNLDSENAVAYSNEFYELSETIKEEERAQRDKFARIRLETDEVIQRNELLSRQKQIWIGVVFGLLLLGLSLFVIVSQLISNNKLKFQQKQQESNQEIYNLMLSQQGKFEEGKQLEQKRISEELHDGILGEMLGIRLILSGLNDREDEASVLQRAELIEKLRGLEEEIRTISHELNDAAYQKIHNFIVSLEDLVNSIGKSSGMACFFTYAGDVEWDNLDGDIKINVYRIVQESLQNCIKHAECTAVRIGFVLQEEQLKLTITDDGIGFDTAKGRRGIGLRNVKARVKKLEGTYTIISKKGDGTTIVVLLPYNKTELNDPRDFLEQEQILNV